MMGHWKPIILMAFGAVAFASAAHAAVPVPLGTAVLNNIKVSALEPLPHGPAMGNDNAIAQRVLAGRKRYASGKVIEPDRLSTK